MLANLYSKLKPQSTMLLSFWPFISYFLFLCPFYLDPWFTLILVSDKPLEEAILHCLLCRGKGQAHIVKNIGSRLGKRIPLKGISSSYQKPCPLTTKVREELPPCTWVREEWPSCARPVLFSYNKVLLSLSLGCTLQLLIAIREEMHMLKQHQRMLIGEGMKPQGRCTAHVHGKRWVQSKTTHILITKEKQKILLLTK